VSVNKTKIIYPGPDQGGWGNWSNCTGPSAARGPPWWHM